MSPSIGRARWCLVRMAQVCKTRRWRAPRQVRWGKFCQYCHSCKSRGAKHGGVCATHRVGARRAGTLQTLREAAQAAPQAAGDYSDAQVSRERTVRPWAAFIGGIWTWSLVRARGAFRSFRIDRMLDVQR